MPVDFPNIESVIRRVTKPVDNIIRTVVSRLVKDEDAAKILLEHIATMPLGPRDTLADLLVGLVENGKTEFPGFLPGRRKYFRAPVPGESDDAYREAAADWMRDVVGDAVEASEIRSGRGWDKQSPVEVLSELPGGLELAMLLRETISRNRKA